MGLDYDYTRMQHLCLVRLVLCGPVLPPTAEVLKAEREVLTQSLLRPGSWIRQEYMFHLEDWFGVPFQFTSIKHLSLAARLRVIRSEALDISGTLHILSLAYADMEAWRSTWYG